MEVAAISRRWNVGIVVWELSKTGELVTPINEPRSTSSNNVENLYLVRYWGNHYNCVFPKIRKPLPMNLDVKDVLSTGAANITRELMIVELSQMLTYLA